MLILKNDRGQGLVEYVILVALVGCASIGMVRLLQHTVKINIGRTVNALQGKGTRPSYESLREDDTRKSDFSNFMNGASSRGPQHED